MAQRMAAGYDLLYRLGKDYEKPEFNIKTVKVDGDDVVIQESVELDKPFCELRRFKRFTDEPAYSPEAEEPAGGADRRAAVGPLCDASARHRPHHAGGPQGLHHRLEECAPGPLVGRRVPSGRLRQLRAGIHSPPAGRIRPLPRHQRVPADRAGAGGRVADGQPRRTDAAVDDHDGRPDRCAQVADRGQQPGDEQELRVVREQRDLPRAAGLSRAPAAACTRAFCSTPASSR